MIDIKNISDPQIIGTVENQPNSTRGMHAAMQESTACMMTVTREYVKE